MIDGSGKILRACAWIVSSDVKSVKHVGSSYFGDSKFNFRCQYRPKCHRFRFRLADSRQGCLHAKGKPWKLAHS